MIGEEEEEFPADASSLIYIAKCDAFDEVARCVSHFLITPSVWEEPVEAGERIRAPEVSRIRKAHRSGLLRRIPLNEDEMKVARSWAKTYRLGRGESEVLAVARRVGRCVIDE